MELFTGKQEIVHMETDSEIRTGILQLFVVMLGRAPGSTELHDYLHTVEDGITLEQLAEQIAATPLFDSIFPESLSNFTFANEFLTRVFGGEVAPEIHLAAVQLVTAFLDEGHSRASVAFLVANALDEIEPGHPAYEDFAGAIARFDNQVAVAEYYSAELPDSNGSGSILADVTSDPATRWAGFTAVDEFSRLGEVFTFTSGIDQLEGTSRDDVFTGNLSLQDQVNGGDGFDIMELIYSDGDIEIPELVSVSGIEKLTVDATGALSGDMSEWTGLEEIVAKNVSSVNVEVGELSSLRLNSDTVTAVNVAGTEYLFLDVYKTDDTTPSDTLETVTASGDMGFIMVAAGMDALRTIDAGGTSGRNSLWVEAGEELESVSSGSGNDYVVVIGEHRADGFSVDLGAGNDQYIAGNAGGKNSSISGGEGRDELRLPDGSWSEMVNNDGDSIYSGFEVLVITGNARPGSSSIPVPHPWHPTGDAGIYNMELLGIPMVQLSSFFIADATLLNAAPGTEIDIIQAEVQQLTYIQKGANEPDSTSDSLTVDLKAFFVPFSPNPWTGDPPHGAHLESLTAHGIETLNVGSFAITTTSISFREFTNTIGSLEGDSVTTLRLSGTSRLEISNVPATVTTVEKRGVWGEIAVSAPNAIGPVSFKGSYDDDEFTGGPGDDVFNGRGGADTFNGGAGSDVYVYDRETDSRVKFASEPYSPANFDIIVNFDNDPNGDKDVIQLHRRLGITQDELDRGLLQKDPITNGNGDEVDPVEDLLEYIGDGKDFFSDGVNDYAVAIVGGGPAHQGVFVFIDVSGDGDFSVATELVIQVLAGDIDVSSFTVV